MKTTLEDTQFGSITVNGQQLERDIIVRLSGEVQKRKKKLSKQIYGTSHTISIEEAKFVYEKGADVLVIGTGQHDSVRLSDEAEKFFKEKGCKVVLHPTPKAIKVFNETKGKKIGLFHVTC